MQPSNEPTNPFVNYYAQEPAYNSSDSNPAYNAYNVAASQNVDNAPSYSGIEDGTLDDQQTVEVDLSKYPEPVESTKKIRGRSDLIEWFCGTVNRELIIAKAFYLFFFSAFGSLLPLMAIYFKNMGMTPTQAGILIGIRPFVGYLSAPFWADLAERLRKGKTMLLCSLAAWVIFNVPIGFIRPPPTSCLVYNSSGFFIETPKMSKLVKRSISNDLYSGNPTSGLIDPYNSSAMSEGGIVSERLSQGFTRNFQELTSSRSEKQELFFDTDIPWDRLMGLDAKTIDVPISTDRYIRVRRQSPMKPTHQVGKSPYSLEFAVNYKPDQQYNWVSPTFSYTIFNLNDIRKVFFLFLLLIVIGEFFCCPSMTLADSAVLNLLGKENADQYGRQRMFASIGWGLTMFFVCLTLDHSHTFSDHPCTVHERERNYTICYVLFTIFMCCTMGVATRLPFTYKDETLPIQQPAETISVQQNSGYRTPGTWNNPKPPPPPPGAPTHTTSEIMGDVLKNLLGKSKVFAQTTSQIPEWMPVLRHFANVKCASFMFVAWFMGFGIGLIFTFLFWHLQDYGGTSTVFGMASVVNHISEILAYFWSYPLIRKIGHTKVICLGLLGNILRFLYISYIREPWGVIPFELIQGVTHSAVWAASCSYIAHNTPPELRVSAQGVLQFIHNGFGRACGTIFGGILSTNYGTTAVLRGYGFACIFVLAAFVFINFYSRQKGFTANLTPAEDPRDIVAELGHLVPHGVPGNPTIVRTASNACLDNQPSNPALQKTYSTVNGSLDIPGVNPTNPFMQPDTTNNFSGISMSTMNTQGGYAAADYTTSSNSPYNYSTGETNYSTGHY